MRQIKEKAPATLSLIHIFIPFPLSITSYKILSPFRLMLILIAHDCEMCIRDRSNGSGMLSQRPAGFLGKELI